jgi:hypothetical protein
MKGFDGQGQCFAFNHGVNSYVCILQCPRLANKAKKQPGNSEPTNIRTIEPKNDKELGKQIFTSAFCCSTFECFESSRPAWASVRFFWKK